MATKKSARQLREWSGRALSQRGLKAPLTVIEPRPVDQWIVAARASGLQPGDAVELITNPAKLQKRAHLLPGVVVEVPSTGVMVQVRFSAPGSAGVGSDGHRTWLQKVPVWKLTQSQAAAEALQFMAHFDSISAASLHHSVAPSITKLSQALEAVGPATHVATLATHRAVHASHTVINGVHVLVSFQVDGTVALSAKGDDEESVSSLLETLASNMRRRPQTESERLTNDRAKDAA